MRRAASAKGSPISQSHSHTEDFRLAASEFQARSLRQQPSFTRAQRRQMQKLAERVDRVTEADARFFERFPHRQYRVRLSGQAEIRQNEIIDGKPWAPPAGFRLFTLVRSIAPGVRMRLYIPAPEGVETDVDEVTARAVFEARATPQVWEIEKALRNVAEARG